MKIGVCTAVENGKFLKDVGFDYIEMNLSNIALLSDEDFKSLLISVEGSPLKPYAFNVLLPRTLSVTGESADDEEMKVYLNSALKRASVLGGKFIVFGSGASRRFSEGFERETAFNQLIQFLKSAGDIAARHSITIVVEPLRKEETNIINSANEGLELVKAVNHPNIKLLVDFYHMTCEKESPDILLKAGIDYIKHIHIANPNGRTWPLSPVEADYEPFFNNLKIIGYEGGISIEGKSDNLIADAPISFNCLEKLVQA